MNQTLRYAKLDWVISFFLSVATLGLLMPGIIPSLFYGVSVLVVVLNRDDLKVSSEIKNFGWLFLLGVIFFTITAESLTPAFKGLYDILRGLLFFPVGVLLGKQLRNERSILLVAILAALAIMLNLFVKQGRGFYGFYVNPNSTALSLMVPLFYLLPALLVRRSHWLTLVSGLGAALGIYLLVLTRGRSYMLGLFLATIVVTYQLVGIKPATKIWIALGSSALFAWFLYFKNQKGVQLSMRGEIWEATILATFQNHPWLGYGLNNGKRMLRSLSFGTAFVHNLFVGVFTSTGVIGLLVFGGLSGKLAATFLRFRLEKNYAYFVGWFGTVCFLTITMFDLKFESYPFVGLISLLLGLIYSSKAVEINQKSSTELAIMNNVIIETDYYPFKLHCFESDYITRKILRHGYFNIYEVQFLVELVKRCDKAVCLDVGANIGTVSLALSTCAAKVYSFEPQIQTYDLLRKNILINQISNCYASNFGLSEKACNAELYINDGNNGASSLINSSLGKDERSPRKSTIVLRTGDSFICEASIEKVDLIKIDVEGHEAEVILGLSATIQKLRPILCFEWNNQLTKTKFLQHALLNNKDVFLDYDICALTNEVKSFIGNTKSNFFRAPLRAIYKRFKKYNRVILEDLVWSESYDLVFLVPKEKRQILFGAASEKIPNDYYLLRGIGGNRLSTARTVQ